MNLDFFESPFNPETVVVVACILTLLEVQVPIS